MSDLDRIDALEHASEEISKDEGRASLLIWFGVLGSPLAWAGHLVLNYSLEEWFACSRSAEHRGHVLGLPVHTMAFVINTAMAVIALLSGLVAWRCWKKLRGADGDEHLDRARWMAFAGVVECCLFLGIILLGYLPELTLRTCVSSP
jgi:hypothetical protein